MRDLITEQRRTEALTVVCDYCRATVGERCVNRATGSLIEHQAAHLVRLTVTGKAGASPR